MKLIVHFLLLLVGISFASSEETVSPLFIEGYGDEVSYAPGEILKLHTSTTGSSFSVSIARLGLKTEPLHTGTNIPGGVAAIPENASSAGCGWPVSYEFEIPVHWKSGYYRVVFSTQDSGGKFVQRGRRTAQSECYFVLRSSDPGSSSKILLQLATNTYNAYNNWGGSSLYGFHGRHGLQGHQVSFHRPPPFPLFEMGTGFREVGGKRGL